jgi:hypothetical protein
MFVLPCRELEEAVLCGHTLPTADGRRLDLSISFNASYTGLISFHLAVGPLAEFNRPEPRRLANSIFCAMAACLRTPNDVSGFYGCSDFHGFLPPA